MFLTNWSLSVEIDDLATGDDICESSEIPFNGVLLCSNCSVLQKSYIGHKKPNITLQLTI